MPTVPAIKPSLQPHRISDKKLQFHARSVVAATPQQGQTAQKRRTRLED